MKKGNELSNQDILHAVQLWMEGKWYHQIAAALNTEVYKVIRLVNNLLGYKLQTLASSVIRVKMAKDRDYVPHPMIFNWPLLLQYGINSTLKHSLFEVGLSDRVAVLHLTDFLQELEIETENEKELVTALLAREDNITKTLVDNTPSIAFQKIIKFLALLKLT